MNVIAMAKAGIAVVKSFAVVNAPIIFIGAAAVGVVSTAVIAWKAGKKSSLAIGQAKAKKGAPLTKTEKVKATWKLWLPVCVSIILTFGCMGASYYVHSVRLAEMTATANALLVNNKELNKELDELSEIVPDKALELKDNKATSVIKRSDTYEEYGDIIYDEFLERSFRMPIEAVETAKSKFIEFYRENHKASIADLYYLLGKPISAGAKNLGWITTYDNIDDLDFPFMRLEKHVVDVVDDGYETRYHLQYYPQAISTKIGSETYWFDRVMEDDLVNDDELMSGINNAFA